MPGIALKMQEKRMRGARLGVAAAGAGNPEGVCIIFGRHKKGRRLWPPRAAQFRGVRSRRSERL
jgi:hypothetical protein